MTASERREIVAVLTDSRGFDTYYLNDRYESWYGADRIFPALLRRHLLRRSQPPLDAVHIPDHFRSGTIENNLLRLGLCDPVYVVLCDGIWETLLNRGHLVDYVTARIGDAALDAPAPERLDLSHDAITRLFLDDKLPVSPGRYADRIGRIASYFARRRRRLCWLSLLIPDPAHKAGVHCAGDYRYPPGWQRCLAAVNERVKTALDAWGASYVDLDPLMRRAGGEAAALLDQWHFTAAFHAVVAAALDDLIIREIGSRDPLPADHVSRRFMVPGKAGAGPLHAIGDTAAEWCRETANIHGAEPVSERTAAALEDAALVVVDPPETRDATARRLLSACAASTIILYPEEIAGIDNPVGTRQRGAER